MSSKPTCWSLPPVILRYAIALFSVTLAVLIIRGIGSYWHSAFFFAIIFSAWFGGFRAGLFAIALSILAYDYCFFNQRDSFAVDYSEIPDLILFGALGLLVAFLAAAQRSTTESLRKARDQMVAKVEELQRTNNALQQKEVERKRAELESERSVAFLSKAQKLTHISSIWWKVTTGEIIWSEESYRLMEYDRATTPSVELIMNRVHPEDLALVQEMFGRSALEGVDMDFTHRLLMPSGAVKYVHVLIQNSGIPAPNFEFLGAIADITEQVRAKEALETALGEIKKSEDRFRTFVDMVPGLAWAASPEGAGEYFNKRWLDYTGLSMEEAVGAGWIVAIHSDDIGMLGQRWVEIMASEKPGEHEARMRRFDGEHRWFLFKAAPLIDEQGKIMRWYGTNTEIEDQKRAENALRRSTVFLTHAQALSHTGSVGLQVSDQTIFWSEETARIYGYDPMTPPTMEMVLQRVHPDDVDKLKDVFARAARGGATFDFEHRLLMPDGSIKHIRNCAHSVKDLSGNEEVLGAVIDITPEYRAQAALEDALAKIKRSEDKLRTIIDTIPALTWSSPEDGLGEFFSKQWLDYTGLSIEEAIGSGWIKAVHPDDLGMLTGTWTNIRASGKEGGFEARLRRFDGVYRWFLFRAAPLPDETGKNLDWYGANFDIDDRKKAEAELKSLIEALPTHVWCAREDGSSEFQNQRWLDYTGLTLEEARGWGWSNALHPEDHDQYIKKWIDIKESRAHGEAEARLRRFDGVYRWFLIRVAPVLDAQGNVIKWYGTSTDIDDRKRAEEALRASEQSLRLMLDSIPGMVTSRNPEGRPEYINQQTIEYFGARIVEMADWSQLLHPDDRERVVNQWRSSIQTGRPYVGAFRAFRADGVYRWLYSHATAIHNDQGQIIRWYNLLTDIDDQKKAEETLRRNKAFMADAQAVSHAGSVGIRVCDGKMTWSEETARIYGYDPTILDPTFEMIFQRVHPEDLEMVKEVYERISLGNQDFNFEHRLKMPDGSVKYLHAIARTVKDADGNDEVLGTLMDITDRKQTQNALNKAQADLAHVTRMTTMGELAASMAHEVKQPLTAVVNNANACLSLLPGSDSALEDVRAALTEIIDDANRASAVMNRVRELAKKSEIEKKLIDLKEVVSEVVALARYESGKRRVVIQAEIPDELPFVLCDRVQCQQVLLNLVLNGMDAMSEVNPSERMLTISGSINTRDGNPEVLVRVQDLGTGIREENVDRLFEAFYTTKAQGMGMGLTISRSIIEAHGGRLWFEANQGTGATFLFSLPLAKRSSVEH